ncbi:MAG: hypothetical protein NUW37_03335 [Planctomycetes bacterium]|nr:hypothetical protein [Planctomycetota bacterium]
MERFDIKAVSEKTKKFYSETHWHGSMLDFLREKFPSNPRKYSRTSYQYLADMIEFFGKHTFEESGEKLTRYHLFDDPFSDGKSRIFGLDRTIARLMKYIKAAAREEGRERIYVLNGPVGTAKTSMIELISRGLEEYSKTEEGEILSFRWIFPADFDKLGQSQVGFHAETREFTDDDIAVSLKSQMRENPLLVIPREMRKEFLRGAFRDTEDPEEHAIIPTKILEGQLNYNDQQILDYLLEKFDGDFEEVCKFIRVERFTISATLGVGIAKVLPEGNIEAQAPMIAMDDNWRAITNLMRSLNLVRFSGHYVSSNRGILHYSDIFKRPIITLHHLLSAVEEHMVCFGEIQTSVDTIIIGTTNIAEYIEVRRAPISKALRSRTRKIDVPYLLNFTDEQQIYERGLLPAMARVHIAPHTTELAALWAVLTRLMKSRMDDSGDLEQDARKLIAGLTPLDKAMIYADRHAEHFSEADRLLLDRKVRKLLRNEFQDEGTGGVPTRILQNILADLCEDEFSRCVMPFDVFKLVDRVLESGPETYDFLAVTPDEGYHDFVSFLKLIRGRYDDILTREIQDAVLDVTTEEIDDKIKRYFQHVNAFNQNEKVRNQQTGKSEDPDEKVMRVVEDAMGVLQDLQARKDFRFRLISRALRHASKKGEEFDYRKVYADLYSAMYRSLYREKRDRISWGNLHSELDEAETEEKLAGMDIDKKVRGVIDTLFANLKNQGYNFESARLVIMYSISRELHKR